MKKILLSVDPRELWKFTLDEDGYRTEVETLESEERYLTELEENQLAIIEHYGFEHQLDKLVEECAELIQARMKAKSGSENIDRFDNVIEEIADIKNIISQMELHWPYMKEGVMAFTKYKMSREIGRINRG